MRVIISFPANNNLIFTGFYTDIHPVIVSDAYLIFFSTGYHSRPIFVQCKQFVYEHLSS